MIAWSEATASQLWINQILSANPP